MTRWRKAGESGFLTVLEEGERFCLVERHNEDGSVWTRDRVPRNKSRGGPRGYAPEDTAQPAKRVTHHWGPTIRVEGHHLGNRCACGVERMDRGNGGRWLYRVKGGTWKEGKAPKCEAKS